MTKDDQTNKYAQMGRAALLPGMMHVLELMQHAIDELRAELEGASVEPRRVDTATKRGRPSKGVEAIKGRASSGWPDDPQERKKEMARRMAKRGKPTNGAPAVPTVALKLHPRDAGHPGHEEWLKKMRAASKKRWKNMSEAARQAAIERMASARESRHVQ